MNRDRKLRRERIDALVTRAVHASTPVEEARTSALIACRLLSEQSAEDAETGPELRQVPPERAGYRPPRGHVTLCILCGAEMWVDYDHASYVAEPMGVGVPVHDTCLRTHLGRP